MCRGVMLPHLPVNSLNSCYWNIHGWTSKEIGSKLTDLEFLDKISKCDIVALSELHCDKEVSLPGFISVKQKIRKKLHKGPKISGGIGIFVKEEYKHLIQVVATENQNSIWVKIKKEFCGENEDIFLGSFYVSPDRKGSMKTDFFSLVNDDIDKLRDKGVVMIQGDSNARTGNEHDFIQFDKVENSLEIKTQICGNSLESENLNNKLNRNSRDKTVNQRGKELLDLCKANDMLITNGRKVGDLFGKLTSHQWNGSALNDYLLAPDYFQHKITHFSVGDYAPWLSDHCPIYSTIHLNSVTKTKDMTDKTYETDPNYMFDEKSKSRFLAGLKSEEISEKIVKLVENDDISTLNLGIEIKKILINNAKSCKVKTKKYKKGDCSAPWFDSECKNKKDNMRKLGKDLKNEPSNQNIRSSLSELKRSFKKIVAYKKRKYKRNITDKMSKSHKSQKEFWKLLDKLSEKRLKPRHMYHISLYLIISKRCLIPRDQSRCPQNVKWKDSLITLSHLTNLRRQGRFCNPGKP